MPLDGVTFSRLDFEQSLFFFRFSKGSARARALRGEAARREKRGRFARRTKKKKRETARSLFHDWTDYNGVAFPIQLLE